jgi:hypothetical protein
MKSTVDPLAILIHRCRHLYIFKHVDEADTLYEAILEAWPDMTREQLTALVSPWLDKDSLMRA